MLFYHLLSFKSGRSGYLPIFSPDLAGNLVVHLQYEFQGLRKRNIASFF